ncbi:Glyoxylase, beta-lactamase superfamily II [Arboricoccus pini]|uniref:Glyoxylase, beta-lactamase superfamily II n=1 Tax=Arboricoccus pini TaxID=1963835 RepID=A0A212RZQ5_9PROT|nr:MBL fold metallo-hydrolase [Arboricoccus pini]SNB78148.1 Glyoxylase, beta-lactamase superfamily II [Arboricoccus pini]
MGEFKGMMVQVTSIRQNCTIWWDETNKLATVVDPGGDVDKLMEATGGQGLDVEQILLTHGHVDHAAGATVLRERLVARSGHPVPILGPDERDRFLLDDLAQSGAKFGITEAAPVTPDRWLKEGDTVTIGGRPFAVLHCPGHTPGSLVYLATELKLALVGDVLFKGSVGRTDFAYGDHEALIQAIRTKLLPLPDDIGFIPGHGHGSTIGAERKSNPFLQD